MRDIRTKKSQFRGAAIACLIAAGALIVAHRDTANEHVHVVVNRAGDDGPTWHRHDDIYKMRDAVGRIDDHGHGRRRRIEAIERGLDRVVPHVEQPFTDRQPQPDAARPSATDRMLFETPRFRREHLWFSIHP